MSEEPEVELEMEVELEAPEPRSLSDLMSADPLSLTKEDRRPIITFYRENRLKFLAGGKVEKVPKPKAEKVPLPKIELGDLDL
jgi:hypothetical protein